MQSKIHSMNIASKKKTNYLYRSIYDLWIEINQNWIRQQFE